MLNVFWEVLSNPMLWVAMALLATLSRVMQWLFNRLPLMCQSVHVVHVPWGILWVTVIAALFGFITYTQVVILACLYLAAYPSMWYLNYVYTQRLMGIFKAKQISRESTGIIVWADEVGWIRELKRHWYRRRGLNEEVIDRILNHHSLNGHHGVRHIYHETTPGRH